MFNLIKLNRKSGIFLFCLNNHFKRMQKTLNINLWLRDQKDEGVLSNSHVDH